jgi:hypothetical protein
MKPYETKHAVEIRLDETGDLLKTAPYGFSRAHAKGEVFTEDSKDYLVLHAAVTFGKHGGTLVEHVVRQLKR